MEKTINGFRGRDKLRREAFAQTITSILNNKDRLKRDDDRQSFVLAIDSAWGTGKTFFLNFLVEHLNKANEAELKKKEENSSHIPENIFVPFLYNSWEYDYWDSAFDPFVNNLLQKKFYDYFEKNEIEAGAKGLFKNLFDISLKLGRGYLAKKCDDLFGEDTVQGLLSKEQIDEYKSNMSDIPILPLFQLHKDISELRQALDKATIPPKHIIFLVDELDRAKPIFAVQTLEMIKHIFDCPRISYIFALDMEQLSHTVKSVYGEGIDSIGYLQRFFDLAISMPQYDIPMGDYIEKMIQERSFDDCTAKTIKEALDQLVKPFSLSLRDINSLISSIGLTIIGKFFTFSPAHYQEAIKTLLNVLCLKMKHRKFYKSLFCDNHLRIANPSESTPNEMNEELNLIRANGGFPFMSFWDSEIIRKPLRELACERSPKESYERMKLEEFQGIFGFAVGYTSLGLDRTMSMADNIASLLITNNWNWQS